MDEALRLTVVYDGDCMLCRRSAHWLEHHQTYVEMVVVAAAQPDAVAAFGATPGYADNILVAASDGRIWIGPPDAYLIVMWAVRGTRALSYVLGLPPLKSLAGRVFQMIAGNRQAIGRFAAGGCEHCAV